MKVIETGFPGLLVVEPLVFTDTRGYFFESFNQCKYADAGIVSNFVQDNESFSTKGVVRGLHYQLNPHAQAKLVRVISGAVFDVVVDIRSGSPTYGKWFGIELSSDNKRQLFIPKGFAHGFSVLSPTVIFSYKCDQYYNKGSERGIRWNDPQLKIEWRVAPDECCISEKDQNAPLFQDADTNFVFPEL